MASLERLRQEGCYKLEVSLDMGCTVASRPAWHAVKTLHPGTFLSEMYWVMQLYQQEVYNSLVLC